MMRHLRKLFSFTQTPPAPVQQALPAAGAINRRPSCSSLIAAILLILCTLRSIYSPIIGYDSWMYHLPFSSYLFHIGRGAESFHLSPALQERWLGFPKAWEWLQGLAWYVTGSLHAIVLPQILLCAGYFFFMARTLKIPASWIILGFFACPLLFIHFESTYTDLPSAICIATGFFLFLDLLFRAKEQANSSLSWWPQALWAIAAFALAGNIKYQGLLGVSCAALIIIILCLILKGISRGMRITIIALVMAASLGAGLSAELNFIRYHNPFYPLEVKLDGQIIFAGPQDPNSDADAPAYPLTGKSEIHFPEPINFLLSATELDWSLRGVAPWYSLDSITGRMQHRGPPSRTGGWGGFFIFLNGALLIVQIARLRREQERQQRAFVIATLLLIITTAFLPRAHELRYWLYIPLALLTTNLRYLSRSCYREIIPGALIALMIYGITLAALSPKSELLTFPSISPTALNAKIPADILGAIHTTGRYCTPNDDRLFRYSEAVTGTASILSPNLADCPSAPE